MKHTFVPSKYYFTYAPNPPVLKVASGDMLTTITVDAGGHDSFEKSIPEERQQHSKDTIFQVSNPLVGPFLLMRLKSGIRLP